MAPARSFTKLGLAAALGCAALAAWFAFAGGAGAQQRQEQRANGWQVCNETSYVLEASTGRPDDRSIQVQGWTRLRPGACELVIGAPLARGTHYLYARTSPAHRGGRRQWGGDAPLCVDPTREFQIENPPQCTDAYEARNFRRVQINKRDSWRTSFSEATQFTLARARQAGIQRLLEDNGYDVREGRRGIDPRRIAQAIAQFRATARLQANASDDQLIDALEQAARRRAETVGLTICNHTNARVWTAIGRRRGEGLESRGWWALNAGGCVRAIDEVLTQEVYYVFANMETSDGPRYLALGGIPFCTSPARFAILGAGECAQRYYGTELFSPVRTHGRQGIVVDLRERSFMEAGETPRQLQLNTGEGDVTLPREPPRRGLAPPTAPTEDRAGPTP
ncbi:MAG: DUF1036 domain-containing protein [Hyphomonadaceae bacterium]